MGTCQPRRASFSTLPTLMNLVYNTNELYIHQAPVKLTDCPCSNRET